MKKNFYLIMVFILFSITLVAQTEEQINKYRNEPHGDKTFRKKGIMDGNLIRTIFRNDGQIGTWPDLPSGEWPKGTGHNYLHGCAPLISTSITAPLNGQIVHPAQISYREEIDFDPVNNELWVLEPVPGYVNPESEDIAISTNSNSWPNYWPRSLPNTDSTWDGFWFGYFGRGVQNSDFETFFVIDDSKDGEFNRPPYGFQPLVSDAQRKGIGLRMEVRGFQWSHVLAEDIIFWHYDIVNLSDFDYDTTYFGFFCDTGVGGSDDNYDDCASYNTFLDIAYAFDKDGKAPPDNWLTGYVGYAFLESPGNGFNGVDDDEDGFIDERRDDLIDNDGDWISFTDLNGNGKWDPEEFEPLNSDVGKDGVSPFDPQYFGPDEGEGDGIPTPGEPNFDATDKDESDQIGLTSLAIERLINQSPNSIWPKNDEVIWRKMQAGSFDTSLQNANIQILFGSGAFPLKQFRRERFSVAIVYGNNYNDLVFNKETVQEIYNANYNFAKPPNKAKLTAIPGDKKVFLFWDDFAEKSVDPFLGYKLDFEGYLVYRSEEPEFNDIKIVTDSKGDPKYWKPIAQYDLKNEISGPDPIGINGAHFWRGDNTGLQHSYVDTNVVNGKKYYYAIVAYDQGDPNFGTKGLLPSETTKIISEDLVGNIKFVDINCAVITPNAPVAGYVPPQISGDLTKPIEGIGTGSLGVSILDPAQILDGASYTVKFNADGEFPNYKTVSYNVTREYNNSTDTLESRVDSTEFGGGKFSKPLDGFAITVNNSAEINVIQEKTGWYVGLSNVEMNVIPDKSNPGRNMKWPADYEVKWLEPDADTTILTKIPVPFKIYNLQTGEEVQAEVIDNNQDKEFGIDDDIVIIQYLRSQPKLTWRITYKIVAAPVYETPRPGDIFRIYTTKPFSNGDYFSFSTRASNVDKEVAGNELNKISVVPNPYISAAAWEKRNLNQTGRGERRIDFVHLPSNCTIRIYTITGALVKTLYKDSGPADGSLSWNLVTDDGMDLAFGLYIYHIDAPEIGEYIGKFAVIK